VDEVLRAAPAGLREALAESGGKVEEAWREGPRGYLGAGAVFARYSLDERDVPVLEHEARVRTLVGEAGALRAPAVLAQGPGWLLERRVEPEGVPVEVVVAAAGELARLELPGAPVTSQRQTLASLRRRVGLLGRPRLAAELVRARRVLAEVRLPHVTTHGDFHPGNVLRANGAAWVIDWELAGRGPAGSDLMRYWATLDDPTERDRVYAGARELAGDERELARLHYAMAVFTAADKLAHPQALNRDAEGAAALVALLPELRAAAK
jgi:hypothetical protein